MIEQAIVCARHFEAYIVPIHNGVGLQRHVACASVVIIDVARVRHVISSHALVVLGFDGLLSTAQDESILFRLR